MGAWALLGIGPLLISGWKVRLEGQNSFGDPLKAGGGGVGWHYRLDGHEFEQARGVGDGQGSLYSAVHGVAELDMTERLN